MYDEFVTEFNTTDSGKQNLGKQIEDIEKKIRDTSTFIETQGFNRLTKINYYAIMTEAQKNLVTKEQVEYTLDLEDENGKKNDKT